MIWIDAILNTLELIVLTSVISFTIGTTTAVAAWWSNTRWAVYFPLLILSVPPWLLSYHISEMFGYINPWVGASISLGVCCSVYPHSLISASLARRAFNLWEMLSVSQGKTFKSLFLATKPSLIISFLPSLAIIAAECLSDFGVSNFFGINTITMTTYNIWSSSWNLNVLWIGICLLVVGGLLISKLDTNVIFSISPGRQNNTSTLIGIVAILPTILLLGTILVISIYWSCNYSQQINTIIPELSNSLLLVGVVMIVCLGVVFSYLNSPIRSFLEKSGLFFYTIPGVVLGAFSLFTFGNLIPLFVLLILTISVRYYGLAVHSIASATKGNQHLFEITDLYIVSKYQQLKTKGQIILPSIIIGMSLIILDVLRELPISLILQPFNFQTLAMRMNYVATTEVITGMGVHSIVLIILGLLFSFLIVSVLYDRNKRYQV